MIAYRMLRATLLAAWQGKQKNRLLTLFVLLIESGTLYVIMLVSILRSLSSQVADSIRRRCLTFLSHRW